MSAQLLWPYRIQYHPIEPRKLTHLIGNHTAVNFDVIPAPISRPTKQQCFAPRRAILPLQIEDLFGADMYKTVRVIEQEWFVEGFRPFGRSSTFSLEKNSERHSTGQPQRVCCISEPRPQWPR